VDLAPQKTTQKGDYHDPDPFPRDEVRPSGNRCRHAWCRGAHSGKRFTRECLTNNEARRGLQRMGWDDIRFVDRHGVRVKVVADWGRRTYAMTVNKCTGRVTDIERLSRPYRPGFHFQFRF